MTSIRVALIQFDAVPEQVERNLRRMGELVEEAARAGARWILFHEGALCDYTPNPYKYAEPVPEGRSTRRMMELAREHDCVISFGISEHADGKYFITQVFVGPQGLIHRYRKTWLWLDEKDWGYRNEWRYDAGTGPELFEVDGVRATCFICADGEAPRCVERARELSPQLVFYPNNRAQLPLEKFAERAAQIGATMLVTNRTGRSWMYHCAGGSAAFSKQGETLVQANCEGREEILLFDLQPAML